MRVLVGVLLGLALAAGAAIAAGVSPVQTLAGVYSESFRNQLVSGESYQAENVLTIVPTGPRAAYVDTSLEFYNGHQCAVSGIAHVEGSDLVYREPESKQVGDERCVLHVGRKGRKVVISDEEGTCKAYCGARGSLSGDDLPVSSRSPITRRYRLKIAGDIRQALQEDAAANAPSKP
jgi:hypothetical protein